MYPWRLIPTAGHAAIRRVCPVAGTDAETRGVGKAPARCVGPLPSLSRSTEPESRSGESESAPQGKVLTVAVVPLRRSTPLDRTDGEEAEIVGPQDIARRCEKEGEPTLR